MRKVCLLADIRTELRNRGIYRNMFRLRAPRNAAIRPRSELISVSLGNLLSVAAFTGGIILIVVASLNLLSDSRKYAAARDEYAMLREIYTREDVAPEPAVTPGSARKPAGSKSAVNPERKKSLLALTKLNPEFTGWITITGTPVSYPVVRGKDNIVYLDATFSGEKNPAGAIFMDYRCLNDFNAPVCILYGHNMKDGTMFAPIVRYLDAEFMFDHPEITITTTENESLTYRIFDARMTDASDMAYSIDFNDGADAVEYFAGPSSGAARVLILSTCLNGRNKEERLLAYFSLVGG